MCLMIMRRSSARAPPSSARSTCCGPAADDRQRAADFVRDAGRQDADRDQLLGAHQLVLQGAQLGLILDQREGADAQLVALDRVTEPGLARRSRRGRSKEGRVGDRCDGTMRTWNCCEPVVTKRCSSRTSPWGFSSACSRLARSRSGAAAASGNASARPAPTRIGPSRSVRKPLASTTRPSRETPSTPSGAFSTMAWLVWRASASACV